MLEAHEGREDEAFACHVFCFLEGFGEFAYGLLVECGLFGGEGAVGVDFGFVGEVRNYGFVGF